MGAKSSDQLIFNYGGEYTGGVRIQGPKTIIDGNVGVGTINPGQKLEVSSSHPVIRIKNDAKSYSDDAFYAFLDGADKDGNEIW